MKGMKSAYKSVLKGLVARKMSQYNKTLYRDIFLAIRLRSGGHKDTLYRWAVSVIPPFGATSDAKIVRPSEERGIQSIRQDGPETHATALH